MVWSSVLRRATIISGLVWMGFRELEISGRAIFQAEKLSLQHKIRPECVYFRISSNGDCRDTAALPIMVLCRNTDHPEHQICSSTALFLGPEITPFLNSCSEIWSDSHFLVFLSIYLDQNLEAQVQLRQKKGINAPLLYLKSLHPVLHFQLNILIKYISARKVSMGLCKQSRWPRGRFTLL